MRDSQPPKGELLVYQTQDGQVRLDVRLTDETVWLTQQMMAELFQTTQQNISLHIRNIYEEGELAPERTHKKFLSVQQEGGRQVRRNLDFMKDWEHKLNEFLEFNERRVLPHAGSVSKKDGEEHAQLEYDKFARLRREYKENLGESESIKALEEAAKQFANPVNYKVNESE